MCSFSEFYLTLTAIFFGQWDGKYDLFHDQ